MTRVNVYTGPSGFYLLRGGPGDLPPGVLPGRGAGIASGAGSYEIPLAIQDRSFNADGSLRYPRSRKDFDDFPGPYEPASDVSPIWNPEFFGDSIMVNGRTWPVLDVEPRRYRLRLLNGCNSRFLVLKIATSPTARPAAAALPIWVIGSDGGFLDAPVQLPQLLMGPAERMDTLVDFTGLRPGTDLYLVNLGPDEPFGELLEPPDPAADPRTTGQVLRFRVVPLRGRDRTVPPDQLTLPGRRPVGRHARIRRLSLNEVASSVPGFDGPAEALLGTYRADGPHPMEWHEPVSENPAVDATEIWELHNFTEDAHPIHLHLVQFDVVGRQSMEPGSRPTPPEVWEHGPKDTVIAYPGAITRIRATFDRAGRFAWHCHILEHEDNEMMRPYRVGS
jgi:bilirubin oxidase